jgi:toxin ParE1/3/4
VSRRRRGQGPKRSTRSIQWTVRAREDLVRIGRFFAQDDPRAAERWVLALIATAERAGEMPNAGHRVPELGRDDVRELLLRSYRVVYLVVDDRITVLTVFEGHRRFPTEAVDDLDPPGE